MSIKIKKKKKASIKWNVRDELSWREHSRNPRGSSPEGSAGSGYEMCNAGKTFGSSLLCGAFRRGNMAATEQSFGCCTCGSFRLIL